MTLSKLRIDNNVLAAEFFADASLLGIQCALEPHHFVWHVNRFFMYDFRYQSGSEIMVNKKNRKFSYPIFQCMEPGRELLHILYSNENDGEYLLPEMRHFDYLWLLKGELENDEVLLQILETIKNIEQVQMALQVPNDKILHKTQLVM